MDERVTMKVEVLRAETLSKLNSLFREKVQLDEQVENNEANIHFNRGIMQAYEYFQKIVAEIEDADKVEQAKNSRALGSSQVKLETTDKVERTASEQHANTVSEAPPVPRTRKAPSE